MTTVAQLIKKLQTLPQDAIVECGKEVHHSYYTSMDYGTVDIDYIGVLDYSDQVKWPTMGGIVYVHLDAE